MTTRQRCCATHDDGAWCRLYHDHLGPHRGWLDDDPTSERVWDDYATAIDTAAPDTILERDSVWEVK